MKHVKKMIIIYLPTGREAKFTTSEVVGDEEYKLVDLIECEENRVNIAWTEDGQKEGEAYVGMPYLLQMWEKI